MIIFAQEYDISTRTAGINEHFPTEKRKRCKFGVGCAHSWVKLVLVGLKILQLGDEIDLITAHNNNRRDKFLRTKSTLSLTLIATLNRFAIITSQ